MSATNVIPFRAQTIELNAGELHLIADASEAALIATGAPFYQRGELVRPVVDEVAASNNRRTKVVRLAPVTVPVMIDHLSRAASFEKFSATKRGMVAADPPENLAKIILGRAGEWTFKPLVGVITAPTMRPDGSLLIKEGYDPATRLLLIDPPAMPAIPERPTRAQALAALGLLAGLLADFPFADEASRAVGLSALISPVVRGALPVVPLHAITAPTSGSGKSYLVDIAAAMLTGDRAPVLSVSDKLDETEKRLAGALLDGNPIVSLDNINGDLYSDLLCQAVERPVVSIRALGGSPLTKIESKACFFATGNNMRLVSDMARRTIVCTLDPALERPELRRFAGNPFAEVVAKRGEYLAAALTIVRAYVVAGRPSNLVPLGSFEAWSDLVRGALVWLGVADPVDTQEAARADDPTIADLKALMSAWHEAVGSEARTAKAIISAAMDRNDYSELIHEALHDALFAVARDNRNNIEALRLGKYLSRQKGRILGGLRLNSNYDRKLKQNVWTVVDGGCSGC